MVGLVKGEHIRVTTASKDVGTMVTCLLGCDPFAGVNVRVAIGGTIAVVVVENAPVAILSIAKNKVHRTVNRCGIGIGAVAIVGHLDSSIKIPIAEDARTNNVHCRIGIQANESNHQ